MGPERERGGIWMFSAISVSSIVSVVFVVVKEVAEFIMNLF